MSTPRLWALGSELDDLGSSSGRGKALRRVGGKKKCAPLLGLAKSIYLYADSPWLSGSLTDTEWDSNFLDCTLIVWKYGLHFLLNNNNNNNNNNNHNSNWVWLVELSTKKSLMNLLNGVCPVKGVGGDCTHPLNFSGMDQESQAGAKVVTGTRGKICRF